MDTLLLPFSPRFIVLTICAVVTALLLGFGIFDPNPKIWGVVLIPISFLAIRLSHSFIHPVVFTSHGPQMTGAQFFTFCIGWLAMLFLLATLYQLELAGKRLDARLRELRELLAT